MLSSASVKIMFCEFQNLQQTVKCEDSLEIVPPGPPVVEAQVTESSPMALEQRLLLEQQMRKHVQLTTQHFLQTYAHPELWRMAGEFKNILVSTRYSCLHTCMISGF